MTAWDLRTGTPRPLGPFPGLCSDTALSPDGVRFARVEGPTVSCRDATHGRDVWVADCSGPPGVRWVRFTAGGSRVVVVSARVSVRDADTGEEVGGFDLPEDVHLSAADVSPDGRWVAICALGGGLRVFDADGRVALAAPPHTHGHRSALAFTADGFRLASGQHGGDKRIDFWDVGTWRPEPSLDFGIGTAMALAFSPDGLLGAAGGFNGRVVVWDMA